MMKYRETLYGLHTAFNTSYSNGQINSTNVALGSKELTKIRSKLGNHFTETAG